MDWKSAPLVVWMNGGPGSTSMYGLFIEHGPFKVDAAGNISRRKTTWAATNNMLYIDQPVGTGFSFTDSVEGRITDQDGVARDLFEFMKQFYMLFPEMLKTDLYVAGESYAGNNYVFEISTSQA
jgi:vitellogenic carboxypeptidase-like protein